MNSVLFQIYYRTNRIKDLSLEDIKSLTDKQKEFLIKRDHIDNLSDEQIEAMDCNIILSKFKYSYNMYEVNKGIVKLACRLNRNDMFQRYPEIIIDDNNAEFDIKWKVVCEVQDIMKRVRCFVHFAQNKTNEIIDILKNDENFESQYIEILRRTPICLSYLPDELQNEIYSNKKFQKELLDPKYIWNSNSSNLKLFQNIPEDKKYLIAFYNYNGSMKSSKEDFIDLLKQNYSSILNEDEIDELVKLHGDYDKSYAANQLVDQRYIEYELVSNILKELDHNPNYYKEIKLLSTRFCDGDIKKTALFLQRYKDTSIREELLNTDQVEDLEKLEYIISRPKKRKINKMEDLSLYEFEELKKLSEIGDLKDSAVINIKGTPDSREYNEIFHYNREVMMINPDGEMEYKEASNSHVYTLLSMLRDTTIDIKEDSNFFTIGVDLARKLDIITAAVENSSIIFYFPKEITEEQKKQYIDLMQGIEDIDNLTISLAIVDENSIESIDEYNNPELAPSQLFSDDFINNYFNIKTIEDKKVSDMAKECISEYKITSSDLREFEEGRRKNKESDQRDKSFEIIREGNEDNDR